MFFSIQLINKKDYEDNFQVKEIVLYFPTEMHQKGVGRRVAVEGSSTDTEREKWMCSALGKLTRK